MAIKENRVSFRLDVLGLFLAGLINTFLALLDAGIILAPGTSASQPDLLLRAAWIAENSLRWQSGHTQLFLELLRAWPSFERCSPLAQPGDRPGLDSRSCRSHRCAH